MAYAKINNVTNANMAKVNNAAKAALGKIGSIDAPPSFDTDAFIFTVNTENAGSATKTFVLPLVNQLSGGSVNFDIAWGDDSTDTITAYNQSEITHIYDSTGTYTITMTTDSDGIRGWEFNNSGDKLKILDVINWGDFNITFNDTFWGCSNLTSSATDAPTVTYANPIRVFSDCTAFDGNVNNWDVTNGRTMYAFFMNATSYNQPLNNWDVSGATSMHSMFSGATSFDQDLSSWDISSVTNFTNFMVDVELSTANYDALLIAWDAQSVTSGISIHFGNSTYTSGGTAAAARANLISSDSWTITDGGTA